MFKNNNKDRLQQIYNLLIEFAKGNFDYQLETSELNDDIDALAVTVNMTMEEIKDLMLHRDFTNSNESYDQMVLLYFILDLTDKILLYNKGIKKYLGYSPKELHQSSFLTLLSTSSKATWKNFKQKLITKKLSHKEKHLTLNFRTKGGLLLKLYCLVGRPVDPKNKMNFIIVTAVEIIQRRKKRERNIQQKVTSKKNASNSHTTSKNEVHLSTLDVSKIQEVHQYLLTHLEKKVPSLVELAHLFGTNEHKLKAGFKKIYGETVFRFLTQERLKRASVLIQFTDLPLKEITYLVGFKSVPHFSRAFKKNFGYTPSNLRKSITTTPPKDES